MFPLVAAVPNKLKVTTSSARVLHAWCCSVMLWAVESVVFQGWKCSWGAQLPFVLSATLLILDTVLSILTAASYQLTPSLLLLVVFPQVLLAFCVRRISTTVILILATTGNARMASTPTRVSAILATWVPSAASRSTSATATLASIKGAASTWSMATSATACWAPQVCKKALDLSM